MEKILELREKREKVWEEQKTITDLAHKEERDLSAEETVKWDKADEDFQSLTDEIDAAEKDEQRKLERDAKMEERKELMKKSVTEPIKPEPNANPEKTQTPEEKRQTDYNDVFKRFLTVGPSACEGTEFRALQADDDVAGGYLVAPEKFVADLIKDLEDSVFVMNRAKVIRLPKAASVGFPELNSRIGDPTWTAELKVGSEDTEMDFAKRQLIPHPLARHIKVSKKLIRVAQIDVVGEVRGGLNYEFATVTENAYLNGTGSNQPLGAMVADDQGISTSRDVSDGNTTTAIKADNLMNCVYKLKAQYRKNASWAFHRDALKAIRKLKDGNGQYLWKAGIATGAPSTILDYPYDESEYMPNTFTTGKYVGILGNWKYYWIAVALDMQIQVLTELFAMTNQNAYVGRFEADGAPVHENAFVRVALA